MSSTHDTIVGLQKLEQIITEFFAKTLHIILEARVPNVIFRGKDGSNFCTPQLSSSSNLHTRSRNKWFNLALHEFPEVIENVELSRKNNPGQLVVDILLLQVPSAQEAAPVFPGSFLSKYPFRKEQSSGSMQKETSSVGRGEHIIERWVVQYVNGNQCSFRNVHAESKQSEQRLHSVEALASCKKLYKRMIPLVRSLYATVRLLPAYRVFRDADSSGKIGSFGLKHRVSSFAEPFTWPEDAKMDNFSFTPIETAYGGITLSVSYLQKLIGFYPESPILPIQFIMDYMGSSLVNPTKTIPSLLTARHEPTCLSSSTDNGSWSYGHGASPSSPHIDLSGKHSATSQAKLSSQATQLPAAKVSAHSLYSPFYFPSSTLSTCAPCNTLLHVEGPLKMIPLSGDRKQCGYQLPTCSSPIHARDEGSPQVKPMGNQVLGASVRWTSGKKQDSSVSPGFQIGDTLQKALSFGRHDMRFTSKVSPSGSPQVSYDSLMLSHTNNYNDFNAFHPFASEYHIPRMEPCDGNDSSAAAPVEKPQHVSAGVLASMLQMAPPLHQDFFHSRSASKVSKCKDKDGDIGDVNATSELVFYKSRTIDQALEELGSYKQMRDLLITHDRPLTR